MPVASTQEKGPSLTPRQLCLLNIKILLTGLAHQQFEDMGASP